MVKFFIRRVLYMIPILFGITLVTFLLFNVAGGDPALQAAGKYATKERITEVRAEMGLDGPLYVQFGRYVKQVLTLDFGRSWATKQKISTMIQSGVGATLSLTIPAFGLGTCITIILALLIAFVRGSFFDQAALVICLAMLSISSLVYILGGQYFLAYHASLFPISGWSADTLGRWQYLGLPILIYVVLMLGSNVLFYRTVFLDQMFQDYVRTAKSKGLSDKAILFKHVLRNALIPIITVLVTQMPFLILGSLLLESFFGIPGLGGLVFKAIQDADFPVIKAMTVISAVLYMLFQLGADILYAFVDPRVQLR